MKKMYQKSSKTSPSSVLYIIWAELLSLNKVRDREREKRWHNRQAHEAGRECALVISAIDEPLA